MAEKASPGRSLTNADARGKGGGGREGQVDGRDLVEPEALRFRWQGLGAEVEADLPESGVARHREQLQQLPAAGLAPEVVQEVGRLRQREGRQGRVHLGRQRRGVVVDRRRRDDLERRAREVALPVGARGQDRPGLRRQLLVVGLHLGQVVPGSRLGSKDGIGVHGQDGAGLRVEGHDGPDPAGQRGLGHLLKPVEDGEGDRLALVAIGEQLAQLAQAGRQA